jgi:predicted nucleic acid-binding protein
VAVVLDSDVVAGFLDRSDALHAAARAAVGELVREHRLLTSAVTYAEVLTGARLGHHDEPQVQGFFDELVSEILPVDIAVADAAASIRSRHRSLRMPDALIAATAHVNVDAELVVTGDARLAGVSALDAEIRRLG